MSAEPSIYDRLTTHDWRELDREELDEMEPAGDVTEQLAFHAAQEVNKLNSERSSLLIAMTIEVSMSLGLATFNDVLDGYQAQLNRLRTLIHIMDRTIAVCEAHDHLYVRAKQSDKDDSQRILNQ